MLAPAAISFTGPVSPPLPLPHVRTPPLLRPSLPLPRRASLSEPVPAALQANRRRLELRPRAMVPINGPKEITVEKGGALRAQGMLLMTAILWGTYPVALKILFSLDGAPSDPLLICAIRFSIMAMAAFFFVPAAQIGPKVLSGRAGLATLELGSLGVLGTLLNTASLESSPSIRVAILLSLINVFTPILAALLGKTLEERKISLQSGLACVLALVSTVYAIAGGDIGNVASAGPSVGDLEAIAAAFVYSSTKVRLGSLTKVVESSTLNAGRFLGSGVVAVAVFAAHLVQADASIAEKWAHFDDPRQWGILIFSALVSGMLASIFQSEGQRTVAPAVAQPIFATLTIWSTLFSFLILHESLNSNEILGGLGIATASAFASVPPKAIGGTVKRIKSTTKRFARAGGYGR